MKNILLAERSPFLVGIYADRLRKSGYNVITTTDADAAISCARRANPDLLILDASIPGAVNNIDGFSVIRALRGDEKLKDLKIVMLANLSIEQEVINFVDFGAIKYFLKEDKTSEEIVEEVKKILS